VIFPVFYAVFRVTLLELLAAYEAEGCRFESCWVYLLFFQCFMGRTQFFVRTVIVTSDLGFQKDYRKTPIQSDWESSESS